MKSTRVPRRAAITLLLVALMLVPASAPTASTTGLGDPDPSKLDPYLVEVLSDTGYGERVQVLVSFEGPVTPEDRSLFDSLGLERLMEFHVTPTIVTLATPSEVNRLTGYHRTRWVEFDEPLEFFMDETTQVVNATDAWRSRVLGSLWGVNGIDGSGVTAVVVDTGIDAGHPDLDYGTKTIRNLKSDTGAGPWYEVENGDTSSGHGTHCAGTVAGNGDASAGSRRGMAPGANLIGLSVGEAAVISGAVGGLEWVYDNSRPGNNPYNIRVVSNSWGGGGGQYDPNDAISDAINRLTYENNVVVVFAAGNSAGDGNDIQSSNYGNTPSAVCVAASGRDGSYITSFSSKGQWNWLDTWPDIAAPGHYIESTSARRTQISAMTQNADTNPYYLAISGTSMATPHVSGLMALLWQAAPSMKVSDVRQDVGLVVSEGGTYRVTVPEEGTYGDLYYDVETWMNGTLDTRIHEAELIIKLTADYIPPDGEGDPDMNNQTANYVPTWNLSGLAGERAHDFCQGYGLINAQRAVGLALALERIRWDHPEATVLDAYTVFEDIFEYGEVAVDTDRLTASWSGEWSRFNEENPITGLFFSANQTRYVYVPESASEVTVSMSWPPFDARRITGGTMRFMIDYNDDGSWDHESAITPELDGTRTETIQVSGSGGQPWRFEIQGYQVKLQRLIDRKQFQEARVEYEMSVSILLSPGNGTAVIPALDRHAIWADLKFAEPSQAYSGNNVSMIRPSYDINNIQWSPSVEAPPPTEVSSFNWWWVVIALIVLLALAYLVARLWPESTPGRLIITVATALGLVKVLHIVKRPVHRVLGLFRRGERPRIEVAEVVEEG